MSDVVGEATLLEIHPVMFRNSPLLFILFVLFIPIGLGLVALGIWWLITKGSKLTITEKQLVGAPWVSRLAGLDLLFGRKGEARMQSNLFVLVNAKITMVREEEEREFN